MRHEAIGLSALLILLQPVACAPSDETDTALLRDALIEIRDAQERAGQSLTLLPDGRVLIAGGADLTLSDPYSGSGFFDFEGFEEAEIWDPTTDATVPAGTWADWRVDHTATLLSDGRVLVLGGMGREDVSGSAEVWDPVAMEFSSAGSLSRPRSGYTVTALPDGRALVVGGEPETWWSDEPFHAAEVWDPATNDFTTAGEFPGHRWYHTANLLPDGRVLVIGGMDRSDPDYRPVASAFVWDPEARNFVLVGPLLEARMSHTATALSDGRVVVIGGDMWDEYPDLTYFSSIELWDPDTGEFSQAGSLIEPRSDHSATLLRDGRVLVLGGGGPDGRFASAEIWDPRTQETSRAHGLSDARYGHSAALLPGGEVLVLGGDGPSPTLPGHEVWTP